MIETIWWLGIITNGLKSPNNLYVEGKNQNSGYESYISNVTVSYNSHLFMNSGNGDYIRFLINYDPPGEYQILITLFTWLDAPYKGVVLDK